MPAQVCKAKLDQVQDVAVKFLHTEGTLYEAESLRRFAEEVALVREAHDAAIVAFRGAWLSTVRPGCLLGLWE